MWLADIEDDIVLVTTSSEFQDDGRLVQCLLDALAGEDLHVVAFRRVRPFQIGRLPRTPTTTAPETASARASRQ